MKQNGKKYIGISKDTITVDGIEYIRVKTIEPEVILKRKLVEYMENLYMEKATPEEVRVLIDVAKVLLEFSSK